MSYRVTSKGQVTIPKRVRDRLNIKSGSAVDFELATDGRVTMAKAGPKAASRSPFSKIRGTATSRMTTDQIMALTRGDA